MKILPTIQFLQKNWQQLKKEEMDNFRSEINGAKIYEFFSFLSIKFRERNLEPSTTDKSTE